MHSIGLNLGLAQRKSGIVEWRILVTQGAEDDVGASSGGNGDGVLFGNKSTTGS